MLNRVAIALLAASVFAAPVLAQTGAAPAVAPVKSAPAAPVKSGPVAKVATPAKFVRHIKKHKRHGGRHIGHVQHAGKHVAFARHGKKSIHKGARGAVQASMKPAARSAN